MTTSELPWSVPVRADGVPEGGRHVVIHADRATRDALARAAGLLDLARLDATFDLTRYGKGGLRVAGTVSASLRQACVVTLDPLDSEIEEAVDVTFVPGQDAANDADSALSLDVAAAAPEPPEPLVDGIVDLGAVATEFLLLAIDPYPRKPGAVFATPAAESTSEHPFAALAALQKGRRDGEP